MKNKHVSKCFEQQCCDLYLRNRESLAPSVFSYVHSLHFNQKASWESQREPVLTFVLISQQVVTPPDLILIAHPPFTLKIDQQ